MNKTSRLIVFDIDGKLCDTQSAEVSCYNQAISEVAGIPLSDIDWSKYPSPTSSSFVYDLLAGDPQIAEKSDRIKHRFVELLHVAREEYPGDFSPIAGALEFLETLQHDDKYDVAIATGGFDLEAEYKLACCDIDLHQYPHATSSDRPQRLDIIPLAIKRAGYELSAAVYFGDAAWDIKVSRELNMPLVGIGRKRKVFDEFDYPIHFPDYLEPKRILDCLERLT